MAMKKGARQLACPAGRRTAVDGCPGRTVWSLLYHGKDLQISLLSFIFTQRSLCNPYKTRWPLGSRQPRPCFPAQVVRTCVRRSVWFCVFAMLGCGPARGAVDPDTNAQNIKDNAVGGTELDKLLGHVSVKSCNALWCMRRIKTRSLPCLQASNSSLMCWPLLHR